MFTCSTSAFSLDGITATTRETVPLSLPDRTFTRSFFLIFSDISCPRTLDDFGSQRDDLHEVLLAQLTTDGAENTGADRLVVGVNDNRRVAVKLHKRAVFTAKFLGGAHD